MRLTDEEEKSSFKYLGMEWRDIIEWPLIYDVDGECSFLLSQYLLHTSLRILKKPQPGSVRVR